MHISYTIHIDAPPEKVWDDSLGPLAPLLALALGRIFRNNVRLESEGLKAHCEGNAS